MSTDSINWRAVVYGAGIATAIVAVTESTLLSVAFGPVGGFIAAAVVGGIAGEFFSDLTKTCGHAARVLSNSSTTTPQAGNAI
jgi:hypothetical protein